MKRNVLITNGGLYKQLTLKDSQNFLTSRRILKRLLQRTTINRQDDVIEIGPGKGHITSLLIEKSHHVTAVELDDYLYCKLYDKFTGIDKLTLIHKDFLQFRLPERSDYKVFANIPFSITTQILRKLTECVNPPIDMWLTMEKGAAKRFLGKPFETKNSLLLKPKFDIEIVYYFCRQDFHPMPNVDVVLIHIKKKDVSDISASEWSTYSKFISDCMNGTGSVFTKR
ncbi:MAG TPA: rRNA adenine N(6)-methyltransferase family protein, partial [Ruminiclostridium sp.]|nr:rRNA adenine N(6)-methyltransferase family protein [Ruminiclostridium sp.]